MSSVAASQWRALGPVLAGLAEVPQDLRVADITQDSREVIAGGAFLACRGHTHHGLEYAPRAVEAGARVILWESAPGVTPPPLDASVVVREVPRLHAQLGLIADRFFGAPSAALQIAAITGTNGKTTCAWLLAQALSLLGRRAAYLGTLGVGSVAPPALQPLMHTTPDAVTLHRLLAGLRADGFDAVAMEVSSHALAQERCAAVRLHTAAFTNLTRDHLDYHGDMASYGAAKARLLEWPALHARVVNVDDAFGRALALRYAADSAAPAPRLWVTACGCRGDGRAAMAHGVDYVYANRVTLTQAGLDIELESSRGARGPVQLSSPLRGTFNAENLLTVLAVLLAWEVPLERACAVLSRCQAAPGRLQPEGGGALPLVLIDYAHTPDALAVALQAARAYCRGQLWCVFGCGGERDTGKRSQMGRIAAEAADQIIVTDDNPRREDPGQIVAAILAGVEQAAGERRTAEAPSVRPGRLPETRVIHQRGEAIGCAIAHAAPMDVVLVAGKGHEDYQVVGSERRPFSDTACVRAALAARAPSPAAAQSKAHG